MQTESDTRRNIQIPTGQLTIWTQQKGTRPQRVWSTWNSRVMAKRCKRKAGPGWGNILHAYQISMARTRILLWSLWEIGHFGPGHCSGCCFCLLGSCRAI